MAAKQLIDGEPPRAEISVASADEAQARTLAVKPIEMDRLTRAH